MGTLIICGLLFCIFLFCIGIKLFYIDEKSLDIILIPDEITNQDKCKYFLCSNNASNNDLQPNVCSEHCNQVLSNKI